MRNEYPLLSGADAPSLANNTSLAARLATAFAVGLVAVVGIVLPATQLLSTSSQTAAASLDKRLAGGTPAPATTVEPAAGTPVAQR